MRYAWVAPVVALAVGSWGCEGGPGFVGGDAEAERYSIVTPGQVTWVADPPVLEAGAELAVLDGDLEEAGPVRMRLRLPDGFEIAPHYHPHFERVTVLEGTLHLGLGEEFDRDATMALPTGSYFYLPAELPHFVYAEGETVIEIDAEGPFDAIYVDPADDPR